DLAGPQRLYPSAQRCSGGGVTLPGRNGPRRKSPMSVLSPSLFAQAIQEHLALKEQNSTLDRNMPLDVYKSEDPFENHPLFKTEEQARLEEQIPLPAADGAVERLGERLGEWGQVQLERVGQSLCDGA